MVYWGKRLWENPSFHTNEGEWCEICLVDNKVYIRGYGNRSVIDSPISWQVIEIPSDTCISIGLFGCRGFQSEAKIIISCTDAIYQVSKLGLKTLLSRGPSPHDLSNGEELVQVKYRISHEVSCCFLSNVGVARSLGPHKESGHKHADLGIEKMMDYDHFAPCFDKALILTDAMRCVPDNDKIISMQQVEWTLTWQFTTDKGCKIYTRGDYHRVIHYRFLGTNGVTDLKSKADDMSKFYQQISLVNAPQPMVPPLPLLSTTGEMKESTGETKESSTDDSISTEETKVNASVPDFDKRNRRTEKAIDCFQKEEMRTAEDYCCYVRKPDGKRERLKLRLTTKACMMTAIKRNCMGLILLPDWLKADKEIVMAAVVQNGMLLKCARCFIADKEVVMAAVRQNPWSLKYAALNSMKKNDARKIVMTAVEQDGYAFVFSRRFASDKEIAKIAVSNYGYTLWCVDEKLKKDKEVVMAAILQDGRALKHASDELKNDKQTVMAAVKNDGRALKSASTILKNDKEVVISAVLQNSSALEFASEKLKVDKDIVAVANIEMASVVPVNVHDRVGDFRSWLQRLGLEHLLSVFEEEEICTLDDVAVLTKEDLKEMNIKIGPRRKLLIALQELKNVASVDNLPFAEAVRLH